MAKAPAEAWQPMQKLYRTPTHGYRRGFRHELASCLATLELLRRTLPDHPAVLTDHFDWFENSTPPKSGPLTIANAIANEIAQLDQLEVDLLLYLVAAHHGKVRVSMQATSKDQSFDFENPNFVGKGMPIRGVREGDVIPETRLPDAQGNPVIVPELELSLAPAAMGLSDRYGRSWNERTLNLLDTLGPFVLGYLEAIVRAADVRASILASEDPELAGVSFTIPEAIGSLDKEDDFTDDNDDDDLELEPELVEAEMEDAND